DGSVQLVGSRSPIRKRFTDSAWELLSALQWCNDYGLSWAEAKERVLDPGSRVGRRWGLYHRGGDVYIVPFGSIGRPWMEDLETHERRTEPPDRQAAVGGGAGRVAGSARAGHRSPVVVRRERALLPAARHRGLDAGAGRRRVQDPLAAAQPPDHQGGEAERDLHAVLAQ